MCQGGHDRGIHPFRRRPAGLAALVLGFSTASASPSPRSGAPPILPLRPQTLSTTPKTNPLTSLLNWPQQAFNKLVPSTTPSWPFWPKTAPKSGTPAASTITSTTTTPSSATITPPKTPPATVTSLVTPSQVAKTTCVPKPHPKPTPAPGGISDVSPAPVPEPRRGALGLAGLVVGGRRFRRGRA